MDTTLEARPRTRKGNKPKFWLIQGDEAVEMMKNEKGKTKNSCTPSILEQDLYLYSDDEDIDHNITSTTDQEQLAKHLKKYSDYIYLEHCSGQN